MRTRQTASERADDGAARVATVETPWQLRLFRKTLKKQQKLRLLLSQLGPLPGRRYLLVTNGDNNGALNWQFRAAGGDWTWVEMEADAAGPIRDLLGEPVLEGRPDRIPVDDASFDVVVSIDVHEHLDDCGPYTRELHRVTRPGGHVIVTTPNGDAWKPVTVVKRMVGMTKEAYGHTVIGYNVRQHVEMLQPAGFTPVASGSYSRFFTETIELGINFTYVKLLSRKKTGAGEGTIAPGTDEQLRRVEKQVKLYSLVYPFLNAVSKLDKLMPFVTGYAVSVVARRDP